MRFPKLALFIALLSPALLTPAYARGGFGGGGGFRGGFGGGFRGGYYGGARFYGGGVYLGLGGWGYGYGYYPYGYYGYPYYGYSPYYSYDPYAYGSYPTYTTPPAAVQPAQPQQVQPQQTQPQYQPQASTSGAQGQYYLIAFSDHSIHAATAYKTVGDQLHWIGLDGQEQQAPLSTVDVRFSQQLNRDRHIDFQIP